MENEEPMDAYYDYYDEYYDWPEPSQAAPRTKADASTVVVVIHFFVDSGSVEEALKPVHAGYRSLAADFADMVFMEARVQQDDEQQVLYELGVGSFPAFVAFKNRGDGPISSYEGTDIDALREFLLLLPQHQRTKKTSMAKALAASGQDPASMSREDWFAAASALAGQEEEAADLGIPGNPPARPPRPKTEAAKKRINPRSRMSPRPGLISPDRPAYSSSRTPRREQLDICVSRKKKTE